MRISLLLTLLFAPLSACSLTGIDQVEATPCATTGTSDLTAAHATCAAELGGAPLRDCEAYVCALQVDDQLFCTVGAPDADGDGVGDAACVPEGTEELRDCDDGDADIAEGHPEICDGKDNNCDGRTDEDVIAVSDPTRRDQAGDATSSGAVGFSAIGENVTAVLARGTMGARDLHLLQGDRPVLVSHADIPSGAIPLTLPESGVDPTLAVTGDTTTTFVVFPFTNCTRLSAGEVVGNTLNLESFPGVGLPTTTGASLDCNDGVRQRAPAAAVSGTNVLIAWLESERRSDCGTGAPAPLRVTATSTNAPLSSPAVDMGMANNAAAPALLAVGTSDIFLLAHGDGNEIVISSLRIDGESVTTIDTLRVDVGASVDELSLTAGPTDDADTAVGVAFSGGCTTGERVGIQRIAVTRSDGSLVAEGEPTMVDDAQSQNHPSVAFGTEFPRGYFVAWREGNERVRGQLLGETTGTSGAAVDILDPSKFEGTPLTRIRGPGVAARAEGGFNTLAYIEGPETGFFESIVSCGAE